MNEKDEKRAARLNEVYKYLFSNFDVKSKTQLADILRIQRTGLSSAFGGSKINLTDNLFTKICAAFPGVFNLDYLLTGKGELLAGDEIKPAVVVSSTQPTIDPSSMVNALIAAHDAAMSAKNETIASLRASLEDKDDLIESLHEQVAELQRQLAQARRTASMGDYTYPVGVADKSKTPRKKL